MFDTFSISTPSSGKLLALSLLLGYQLLEFDSEDSKYRRGLISTIGTNMSALSPGARGVGFSSRETISLALDITEVLGGWPNRVVYN